MWPLGIGAIELIFWYRPFRSRETGARLIAGLIGAGLLVQPVLLSPILADVLQAPVSWPVWCFFVYVALSHLAYALFGRDFN